MKKTTTRKNSVSAVPLAVTAAPKAPTATKPVAASTASSAPVAPVKAAAAKSIIVTTAAPITIEAKINVGFGNKLFVRGQGAGLSWDRGTPLECVDSQTWRLIVPAKDKLQFKLLLNDTVWAQGDDLVATPGRKVEVTPAF